MFQVHPSRKYFAVGEQGYEPEILIFEYPSLKLYRICRKGTETNYAFLSFSPDGKKIKWKLWKIISFIHNSHLYYLFYKLKEAIIQFLKIEVVSLFRWKAGLSWIKSWLHADYLGLEEGENYLEIESARTGYPTT